MNDWMRKNVWDSDYRPEQLFVRDYLAELHPDWIIKTEYGVSGLSIDGRPHPSCKPDIAVPAENLIIRLNGMYHYTSDGQRNKDEYQKIALEQAGWTVIDFDCRKMENLFKKKKNEETIKLAREEVLKYLG